MKKFFLLIGLVVMVMVPFYEHDNNFSCRQNIDNLSADISKGRIYYFRVFVECRQHFNDDELDQLYRASGLFMKKQPKEFIQVLSEFAIDGRELKAALVKLPLDSYNGNDQKQAEINERIRLLTGLAHSKTQTKALDVLHKELDIIMNHQQQPDVDNAKTDRIR